MPDQAQGAGRRNSQVAQVCNSRYQDKKDGADGAKRLFEKRHVRCAAVCTGFRLASRVGSSVSAEWADGVGGRLWISLPIN